MNGSIDWLQATALGVLQGLTEFLPISSSGHLVLGQIALGLKEPQVLFDVLLHVGTLAAVLAIYGKDAWRILRAWLLALFGRGDDPVSVRTGWLIILGTLPAAIIGLLFEDFIESIFGSPRTVSFALIATGALLFFTNSGAPGNRGEEEMTWRDALLIGVFQAIAIMPGISRSGSTIACALFLKIDREHAARFSFLLSIPAIGGAFILKARHLTEVTSPDIFPFLIGMIAAAGSGVLALSWLVRLVRRGNLRGFAYYCWAVGAVGVFLF
jgi:undecaprenyl-diphosphatase